MKLQTAPTAPPDTVPLPLWDSVTVLDEAGLVQLAEIGKCMFDGNVSGPVPVPVTTFVTRILGTARPHFHSLRTVTVVCGLLAITVADGINTGGNHVAVPKPWLAQIGSSEVGGAGGISVSVQLVPRGAIKVPVPLVPPGPTLATSPTLVGVLAGLQLALTV